MPDLIETRELRTHFPISGGIWGRTVGHVKAVDGVDVRVAPGEIVAVVGESGCGKSTLGLSIAGLVPVTSGKLFLDGNEIDTGRPSSWRPYRRNIQIVFQDPFTSLNPRHTVIRILSEPLRLYQICPPREYRSKCAELLDQVGMPSSYLDRFPHEFSGGQRQRIAIARLLSLRPRVLICDEVVSALDVSIQAQIIQLLLGLRKQMGLSLLFITHDLSLVKTISDRIYVMYLGKVVESAPTASFFSHPRHPYSQALLSSIPTMDRSVRPALLGGEVPSPVNVPAGCVFQGRCPMVQDDCRIKHPGFTDLSPSSVACYHPLA